MKHIVEEQGLLFRFVGGTAGTPALEFGARPGDTSHFGAVSLADLRAAHESFFPRLMGADAAVEANF